MPESAKKPSSTEKMLNYLRVSEKVDSAPLIKVPAPKGTRLEMIQPRTKTGVRGGDCPPPHKGF
jgi:hypothetical protein